jgi:hypothetical protein
MSREIRTMILAGKFYSPKWGKGGRELKGLKGL